MKLIPLTKGKFAQIDDEDYEYLMQSNWQAEVCKERYCARRSKPRKYIGEYERSMHRLLMSPKKGELIDHIDRNPLNNQKSNLRVCNYSQNAANRKVRKAASEYTGVTIKRTGKNIYWRASLIKNYKFNLLGYFPHTSEGEIAAAKAYDEAAIKFHGEFANLNFKPL